MTTAHDRAAPRRPLTAQVILRPASLRPGDAPVTAANLAHALPDPHTARRVQDYFRRAGFEVGVPLATSFAIVGPPEEFVAAFGLDRSELGSMLTGAAETLELDLSRLPDDVRDGIEAVVVTALPDFGPGNP